MGTLDVDTDTDSDDDKYFEAARPESFASQSTIGSMRERNHGLAAADQAAHLQAINDKTKTPVADRAGLPKRSASVAIEAKPIKRQVGPVLGGQYIDGGNEGTF
jgi:hypothetical protein